MVGNEVGSERAFLRTQTYYKCIGQPPEGANGILLSVLRDDEWFSKWYHPGRGSKKRCHPLRLRVILHSVLEAYRRRYSSCGASGWKGATVKGWIWTIGSGRYQWRWRSESSLKMMRNVSMKLFKLLRCTHENCCDLLEPAEVKWWKAPNTNLVSNLVCRARQKAHSHLQFTWRNRNALKNSLDCFASARNTNQLFRYWVSERSH